MRVAMEVDGVHLEVQLERRPDGSFYAIVEGEAFEVRVTGEGATRVAALAGTRIPIERRAPDRLAVDGIEYPFAVLEVHRGRLGNGARESQGARIRPPMAGKLAAVHVRGGEKVSRGDVLFVLEAMKMHNEVRSPVSGVVAAVHAKAGDAVETGKVIVDIEPQP